MTQSILDLLRIRADRIRDEGIRLIGDYSNIQPANKPGEELIFLHPDGVNFWKNLPPEGKQIQVKLLPEIGRFSELLQSLTLNLPKSAQKDLQQALKKIRKSVEQEGNTWWKSPSEAVEGFQSLLEKTIKPLEEYYDESTEECLVIADTSALILNPNIGQWRFEGVKKFTVVLTPTVLSELDNHKTNHRNEKVREKAKSIIRRIKGYKSHGSLPDGVPVVTGSVYLRSIATEPNMAQSLPWLDPGVADDRFLASAIEVLRTDLAKRACIVTSDINLQNKAEMAGLPYCEVPESELKTGSQ